MLLYNVRVYEADSEEAIKQCQVLLEEQLCEDRGCLQLHD